MSSEPTLVTRAGSPLAYTRSGRGAPLVLLHGLGTSRESWAPVLPILAERFDVISVDLPGFGDSPALPADVDASPAGLAAALVVLLEDLDLRAPHVVGNSLGGWVALELAQLHDVASLTLLSPAGMWKKHTPRYCRISLRTTRWFAEHAERPLCWSVRFRWGRLLILGQSHGQPLSIPVTQAQASVRAMGRCVGFPRVFEATLDARYVATTPLDVPTTVAFGSRDRILLRRQSRRTAELPVGTRVRALPGCGHVPMADDPAAVAALIVAAVFSAASRPTHINS